MNPAPAKIPLLLIHGALRSHRGLWPTALYFRRHGFDARCFSYASRQNNLAQHVQSLENFINAWFQDKPVPVLNILTHSLGALVARAYLSGTQAPLHSLHQRLVMLGPPNQGAILAEKFEAWRLFHWIYGHAARELHPAKAKLLSPLPSSTQALVLAGGKNHDRGYLPWIPGDNDGLVGLEETKLAGADFDFVGGAHSWLLWRKKVLEKAEHFFIQ